MITGGASWGTALRSFLDRRVLAMFFLGFSAGIPLLLIFSSLSLWLREAGVERRGRLRDGCPGRVGADRCGDPTGRLLGVDADP